MPSNCCTWSCCGFICVCSTCCKGSNNKIKPENENQEPARKSSLKHSPSKPVDSRMEHPADNGPKSHSIHVKSQSLTVSPAPDSQTEHPNLSVNVKTKADRERLDGTTVFHVNQAARNNLTVHWNTPFSGSFQTVSSSAADHKHQHHIPSKTRVSPAPTASQVTVVTTGSTTTLNESNIHPAGSNSTTSRLLSSSTPTCLSPNNGNGSSRLPLPTSHHLTPNNSTARQFSFPSATAKPPNLAGNQSSQGTAVFSTVSSQTEKPKPVSNESPAATQQNQNSPIPLPHAMEQVTDEPTQSSAVSSAFEDFRSPPPARRLLENQKASTPEVLIIPKDLFIGSFEAARETAVKNSEKANVPIESAAASTTTPSVQPPLRRLSPRRSNIFFSNVSQTRQAHATPPLKAKPTPPLPGKPSPIHLAIPAKQDQAEMPTLSLEI